MSLKAKTQVMDRNGNVRAQAAKAGRQASEQARQASKQAQQAAKQARQAAKQVGPLTSSAKVTASERVHRMRAWAAPRLESSGHTLEERVAPKMSAMLSSAAKRVDPDPGKRRRWPFLVAGLVALAAAAGVVLNRRGTGKPWTKGEPQQDTAVDSTTPESADSKVSANAKVHTS
jgi:hypothetical protein